MSKFKKACRTCKICNACIYTHKNENSSVDLCVQWDYR